MRKIFALLLVVALACSLTACGSKPSEEAAQVYDTICKARADYEQIQQKLFKAAQLAKEDPGKVQQENYAWLAENLSIPEQELRMGASRYFKGDEWDQMSQEDKEMMAAVAEMGMLIFGDPAFGENALAEFCAGAVNDAYWENGVRVQILKDLNEAEELLNTMEEDPLYQQLHSYLFGLYDYMYYTSEENLEDYAMNGELLQIYTDELNKVSQPLEEIFGVPEKE